jgi:hypothetical protein
VCLILGTKAGAVKQLVSEEALMSAQALEAPRFIRKTQLAPNEYRKNFHQLDNDIILAITSPEADQVTPLMSKIYLRLTTAPAHCWERDGVLRFEAEWREGKHVKAWSVLCDVLGVASATASKALTWMHDVSVIGYFSGKNGVGIRIFLNRAANSIGSRVPQGGKKILPFAPASNNYSPASQNEPAFNDSFAVPDVNSDSDLSPRAPKSGAPDEKTADKKASDPHPAPTDEIHHVPEEKEISSDNSPISPMISIDEIVRRIRDEIEPAVENAARRAAHQEHERTREWLENRGLPKAARVAQHEAYNVLRKYGVINESARSSSRHSEVGRSDYTAPEPHPLSPDEITEMAGVCVAMLETRGQSIELTLSEMSTEAGGFLLPEDAPRVREKASSLLSERNGRDGN